MMPTMEGTSEVPLVALPQEGKNVVFRTGSFTTVRNGKAST